jgi:hypothetical protein
MLLTFSCSKDEKDSTANYPALGITSVTINGVQIPVKDGTLLDVSKINSIAVDGMENNVAKKQIQMSYIVATESGSPLSIQVESSCATTSIVISEEQIMNSTTYKVTVTREGYKEQIIYIFQSLPISAS